MRSKYIEKNTVTKLRTVIGADRWLPLRISLETGLRIGDCLSLRFSSLKKNAAKEPNVGYIYYIITKAQKTGKVGTFRISEQLYKILKAQPGRPSDYIFRSYGKSGHLTRQAAWARMKSAAERLGIEKDGISPHSLRKCFAVALRHEQGLAAVREALQHNSAAVTRVYAYADTILNFDSDAAIRWMDVEILVDYILERLHEKV